MSHDETIKKYKNEIIKQLEKNCDLSLLDLIIKLLKKSDLKTNF